MENHPLNPQETVLVTGATGFLGEYLVRRLVKKYRVLALGRNKEKGKILEKSGAVFCPGDFTVREQCAQYFKGVHYVVHAGALSSVWGKWEDFFLTNVQELPGGKIMPGKQCQTAGLFVIAQHLQRKKGSVSSPGRTISRT